MKHQDLIDQMTLGEKCALLSGRDEWHTCDIPRLGIPAMALSDGPSGLRRQAGEGDHLGLNTSAKATCIPSASTLANGWDPALTEAMGAIVGADAREQDVQVLLGPGLNTKRSPLCGRSFEYYSEDPYLAGKLAAGFVRGVQQNGVAACVKHFAVNSQEHLRMHSDSVLDERTLRELYLTNFEIAVKEGRPRALMTSYNRVNGVYANENPYLYRVLRKEWGYEGMVVTDWGGSNDFVEGVRAGMDLEMPAAGADSPARLLEAVKEGRIAETEVDARVDELMDVILTTTAVQPVPADGERRHEAARAAAERCAVLLKNDNSILPLAADAKVAVIGDFAARPRYQGVGSSLVNARRVESTLDLLADYFPHNVGYAQGFERMDRENVELEEEALWLATQADCVLVYIGLPEGFETEGMDRSHMRLPKNQTQLVHRLALVNPHVIAVLSCGAAVETPWAEDCEALLYGGLGGEAGAEALLRLIRGDAVPGGKLAETFPLVYEDMPVSRYYPGPEATSEYREGLYVGYRWFATAGKPVRYPFGCGLSYTTFAYDGLCVGRDSVSFDVKNTGDRDGEEIVQLYVSLPEAAVFRPERELKGFQRVFLQAGETKRVMIPFDEYTFRFFDGESGRFEIEPGTYTLRVGASSEDIRLEGTIRREGTCERIPYAGPLLECYRACELDAVSDESFQSLLGRPIPAHTWDRSRPLEMNDTLRQLCYARNPLARRIYKLLTRRVEKADAEGKPDLNLLFIYNIPFRGIAKMLGGMVSMAMAEDLLLMANGHGFRGLGRLLRDFFRRPKGVEK